jgi:hypothetical protein
VTGGKFEKHGTTTEDNGQLIPPDPNQKEKMVLAMKIRPKLKEYRKFSTQLFISIQQHLTKPIRRTPHPPPNAPQLQTTSRHHRKSTAQLVLRQHRQPPRPRRDSPAMGQQRNHLRRRPRPRGAACPRGPRPALGFHHSQLRGLLPDHFSRRVINQHLRAANRSLRRHPELDPVSDSALRVYRVVVLCA